MLLLLKPPVATQAEGVFPRLRGPPPSHLPRDRAQMPRSPNCRFLSGFGPWEHQWQTGGDLVLDHTRRTEPANVIGDLGEESLSIDLLW